MWVSRGTDVSSQLPPGKRRPSMALSMKASASPESGPAGRRRRNDIRESACKLGREPGPPVRGQRPRTELVATRRSCVGRSRSSRCSGSRGPKGQNCHATMCNRNSQGATPAPPPSLRDVVRRRFVLACLRAAASRSTAWQGRRARRLGSAAGRRPLARGRPLRKLEYIPLSALWLTRIGRWCVNGRQVWHRCTGLATSPATEYCALQALATTTVTTGLNILQLRQKQPDGDRRGRSRRRPRRWRAARATTSSALATAPKLPIAPRSRAR